LIKFIDEDTSSWKHCLNEVYVFVMHSRKATADTCRCTQFFWYSLNINFKLYDYVACEYDSFWWIGVIEEISDGNLEVKVKFMFPHGPSPFFIWPS